MKERIKDHLYNLGKDFDSHTGDNPKDFENERETVLTDVDLKEIDQTEEEKITGNNSL